MDALLYVSKKRSLLMGVAMLLVLIYHFFSWTYNPMGRFNLGYIGVDLFLFLSGFGLEYSFNKNSLLQFYINRFKRVYPIYFIAVLGGYFIFKQYNFSDLLLNLTTLGYYVNNGINRFDWYVESLFTLYVLFPLFHYYNTSVNFYR